MGTDLFIQSNQINLTPFFPQAPLDVLYDAAAYRIRAVTQFLENLAFREQISSDAVVLHDFALLLAIPLRDGCDLLDVIGRKLNSQVL